MKKASKSSGGPIWLGGILLVIGFVFTLGGIVPSFNTLMAYANGSVSVHVIEFSGLEDNQRAKSSGPLVYRHLGLKEDKKVFIYSLSKLKRYTKVNANCYQERCYYVSNRHVLSIQPIRYWIDIAIGLITIILGFLSILFRNKINEINRRYDDK